MGRYFEGTGEGEVLRLGMISEFLRNILTLRDELNMIASGKDKEEKVALSILRKFDLHQERD